MGGTPACGPPACPSATSPISRGGCGSSPSPIPPATASASAAPSPAEPLTFDLGRRLTVGAVRTYTIGGGGGAQRVHPLRPALLRGHRPGRAGHPHRRGVPPLRRGHPR